MECGPTWKSLHSRSHSAEMVLISLEIVLCLACMCPDDNLARGEHAFVQYCPFMEIGEPLLAIGLY